MGKAIASQLSIDDHDTLGRWMSYRIAELIGRGDDDESTRAEITATILQLWSHRTSWPNGWPPEPARRHLSWLIGGRHGGNPHLDEPKAQLMARIANALSDEYRFWLWATSALADGSDDDAWDVFQPYLPWSERRIIGRLNELLRNAATDEASASDTGSEVSHDRQQLARNELNSLFRTRRQLLSEALNLGREEPEGVDAGTE